MKKKLRIKKNTHLRAVHVGEGLPPITSIHEELLDMTDVLLGRTEPPIDAGRMTLLEIAEAYYSRAAELTMLIQAGERSGSVPKGSNYYRLRTGELRTFMDMARKAADLGSRRVSNDKLDFDMVIYGRETKGL